MSITRIFSFPRLKVVDNFMQISAQKEDEKICCISRSQLFFKDVFHFRLCSGKRATNSRASNNNNKKEKRMTSVLFASP